MPQPGALIEAFSPKPGRFFRMMYSRKLQADHCRQTAGMDGRWFSPRGAR